MRILVYEFVSGGGCAGLAVAAALAAEGLAMRTALVADLAATGSHEIVTTTDVRFRRPAPERVEVVEVRPGSVAVIEALMASVDAVWLVAPETNRCLEGLAADVERGGRILLGSNSVAIRRASDKSGLPRRLARIDVRHPETITLPRGSDAYGNAGRLGYPVVVKPRRGAGSHGVRLARNEQELRTAIAACDGACAPFGTTAARTGQRGVVIQRYLRGVPASVSLLADGRSAVALAVSRQRMSASSGFAYLGGRTPLDHPQAASAADAAIRTCVALPGLRGYVGVDVLLTDTGPVVIEVNARLTTAYLGVRAVFDENVAELALAACQGALPAQPVARRRVRFTASGLVAAA
jgi:predicted ATP-grasp superfamily ATP-dependent carboligase